MHKIIVKLNQSKHVEKKILKIIDQFRSKFDKLTPNEKLNIKYDHSFKKPCQVHVISSPSNNKHLLIITQLESICDKNFYYYSLKPKSFPEQLEKIIRTTKWTIHNDMDLKHNIENLFLNFGQQISDTYNIPKSKIFTILSSPHNKFFMLMIVGNILEINYDGYLAEQIKKKYEEYQKLDKEQNIDPKKITISNTNVGFVSVFDPPIIIGKFNPTFSQKIRSQEFDILNKDIVTINFQENIITIAKSGKMWIDNNDKKTAQKIFNTIMAIALLFDIPTQTIRLSDLAEIKFNIKTRSISQYSWSHLSNINNYLNYDCRTMITRVYRKKISIGLLSNIIKITESVIKNYEYTHYLRLILGAHTQLNNEDNSQSFIISWTIIENSLRKKWIKKIGFSEMDENVKKKLEGSPIDKILDDLYIRKIISHDYYLQLKSLQKTRNKIIHRGDIVSYGSAKNCYNMALDIINDIVKDIVNLSGIHA